MAMPGKKHNLELLILASDQLEPLLDKLIFVGGATSGLLITDPAAPDIRFTVDVDVIVEIQHYTDYKKLEQELMKLGFKPSLQEDAPVCRFEYENLTLDVMPTDERILGFSNRWYQDAIKSATSTMLPNGKKLNHVTAPYFVATKLEAFAGRGNHDFMASHDFEDLIAIVNGRPELVEEINNAPAPLQKYIAECFRNYLKDSNMQQALPGVMPEQQADDRRIQIVVKRMQSISNIESSS
ncbi:MAG: hypothetical protein WD005_04110 [Haliea sp.]